MPANAHCKGREDVPSHRYRLLFLFFSFISPSSFPFFSPSSLFILLLLPLTFSYTSFYFPPFSSIFFIRYIPTLHRNVSASVRLTRLNGMANGIRQPHSLDARGPCTGLLFSLLTSLFSFLIFLGHGWWVLFQRGNRISLALWFWLRYGVRFGRST